MSPNNKQLAQEWFKSANSDFRYAELGLLEGDIYPQVAFLSQQVAEKYLKGYLVFNEVQPSKTHELPKLLDQCVKINRNLEILRDACETLVGFYIETRYPPPTSRIIQNKKFKKHLKTQDLLKRK